MGFFYLFLQSHGFSVDGRFWFLFVVKTAAVVIIAGRLLMRRSSPSDQNKSRQPRGKRPNSATNEALIRPEIALLAG
jgi:hypothetical protein